MRQQRDFYDDLYLGRKGEQLMGNFTILKINEMLKTHQYQITDVGDGKSWDFKAIAYPVKDGKMSIFHDEEKEKIYCEVKTDVYHRKTNNMFIELKSRSRKSGLDITKSNMFVYFFIRKDLYPIDNVWIIKTEKLKSIVNELRNDPKYKKNGGDNNTSEGVILPLEEIKKHFNVFTYTNYEIEYSQILGVDNKIITKKQIGFEF